jgi:hypothetical protein
MTHLTDRNGSSDSSIAEVMIIKGATLQTREDWIEENRQLFLDNLAFFVPELPTDLHDTVLPVFKKIPATSMRRKGRGPEATGWSIGENGVECAVTLLPDVLLSQNLELYRKVPEIVTLQTTLWDWSKKYDLNVPWFLDVALLTLYSWATPSKLAEPHLIFGNDLYFETLWNFKMRRSREPFPYQHSAWQVGQSWSHYEQQQLAAFRAHLQEHKQSTLDGGFTADVLENPDHITWLALAYGKGLNFKQIADLPEKERHWHGPMLGVRTRKKKAVLEESAIGKAVRSTAELIGLPKLRIRPGRPTNAPKSGSTNTRR